MSLADELTTLSALANELDQKSVVHLLQIALDNNILPIVPLKPDWHVFRTCFIGLHSSNQLVPELKHKRSASYVQGVECLELDKSTCLQLFQDGHVTVSTVGTVYVASNDSTGFSKRTAKRPEAQNPFLDKGVGKLPLLMPCFAVFNEGGTGLSVIQSRQTVEDFKSSPGVRVKIDALRFLPSDETKLRAQFIKQVPALELIDTSGSHISKKFGQLLEVFNNNRQLLQDKRRLGSSNPARKDVVELLYQSLRKIDEVTWESDTLCKYATQLIFPRRPSEGGTKRRSPYRADGMPIMLDALLKKLKSDYEKLLNYETFEYEEWLEINKISAIAKEAQYIISIVRLTPSSRGGKRSQKSPKH